MLSDRKLRDFKDSDPLKKREEFAITLRKKKKTEILKKKRFKSLFHSDYAEVFSKYEDCPYF